MILRFLRSLGVFIYHYKRGWVIFFKRSSWFVGPKEDNPKES